MLPGRYLRSFRVGLRSVYKSGGLSRKDNHGRVVGIERSDWDKMRADNNAPIIYKHECSGLIKPTSVDIGAWRIPIDLLTDLGKSLVEGQIKFIKYGGL